MEKENINKGTEKECSFAGKDFRLLCQIAACTGLHVLLFTLNMRYPHRKKMFYEINNITNSFCSDVLIEKLLRVRIIKQLILRNLNP